jgi:putative cell wall-binding protein
MNTINASHYRLHEGEFESPHEDCRVSAVAGVHTPVLAAFLAMLAIVILLLAPAGASALPPYSDGTDPANVPHDYERTSDYYRFIDPGYDEEVASRTYYAVDENDKLYSSQFATVKVKPGIPDTFCLKLESQIGGKLASITGGTSDGVCITLWYPESISESEVSARLWGNSEVEFVSTREYFSASIMDGGFYRRSGSDRYKTNIAVANIISGFGNPDSSTVAVVVSGADENFPDALSASGLAGAFHAPLLLTRPDSLPADTSAYIKSHTFTRVLVVGGESAVSNEVIAEVRNAAGKSCRVERVGGVDRYATAVSIYNYVEHDNSSTGWANPNGYQRPEYPSGFAGWKSSAGKKMALLATGEDFPDALALSSISYYCHYPILLTDGESITGELAATLESGGFDEVLVAGGTAAVSDDVRGEVSALVDPQSLDGSDGDWCWETAGKDRYETAVLIARAGLNEGLNDVEADHEETYVIAAGESFADAASASMLGAPVLFVSNRHGTAEAVGFFSSQIERRPSCNYGHNLLAIGGQNVVNAETASKCVNAWLHMEREW